MDRLHEWRFNRRVKGLYAKLRKTDAMYYALIEKARKSNKPPQEIDALVEQHRLERELILDEIDLDVTAYLWALAKRLLVIFPDDPTLWRDCQELKGSTVLTEDGIAKLKSAIDQEKQKRAVGRPTWKEAFLLWSIAIIGGLGALSGLIAVIYFVAVARR